MTIVYARDDVRLRKIGGPLKGLSRRIKLAARRQRIQRQHVSLPSNGPGYTASLMTSNPPTILDLARHLRVSSTTVWRALNGSPRVSAQTRKRVLRAAEQMNYRPSLVAQTLLRGRTQTLGVLVPTIGNSVHAALVRAVEQVAFQHKYNIMLCDTDFQIERQQTYLDLLARRRVEGVIIVHFVRGEDAPLDPLLMMQAQGTAVVAMQFDLPDDRFCRVVPDNAGAACAMTEHLIGLGHRRIAFVHGGIDAWNIPMRQRLEGYRAALKKNRIAFDSGLIVQAGSFEAGLTGGMAEFWPETIAALLRAPHRPSAIFAPVDILAIKAMHAAADMGLSVPGDIAVAGFDDILMSEYTTPALTTVRHPSAQVGQLAAARLFERIAGAAGPPTYERVPCELIIRKSCGAT
jgi:LacI family transcriptional regulator